jgi:hypothetical protein
MIELNIFSILSLLFTFIPLESPAIYGGDNKNKASIPYRKGGVNALSFLTGFTYSVIVFRDRGLYFCFCISLIILEIIFITLFAHYDLGMHLVHDQWDYIRGHSSRPSQRRTFLQGWLLAFFGLYEVSLSHSQLLCQEYQQSLGG